jgi:hypothetical protein
MLPSNWISCIFDALSCDVFLVIRLKSVNLAIGSAAKLGCPSRHSINSPTRLLLQSHSKQMPVRALVITTISCTFYCTVVFRHKVVPAIDREHAHLGSCESEAGEVLDNHGS